MSPQELDPNAIDPADPKWLDVRHRLEEPTDSNCRYDGMPWPCPVRGLLTRLEQRRDLEDELYAFMIGLLIGQDRLLGILRNRWDEFRAARA